MSPIPRLPPGYAGLALFSHGFRPFFLAGAAWSAMAVLLWLPQFYGEIALPTAFAPRDWHIHEMLFGYLAAVVTGFLLTAIPNWTGSLPVAGMPLVGLFALWLAGRITVILSSTIGIALTAVIDSTFLITLAGVALREIVVGRNWRNLRVLGILSVFITGNVVFHIEAAFWGTADYGIRIGIAAAIGLIMLIGGRIVPSFTRNWLARKESGRLPLPFSRFDALSIALGGATLAMWIARPVSLITSGLLVAAGVLHVIRLARWAGDRTIADRLVLILHIGYSFVPIGFFMTGVTAYWPQILPASAGIHAWTSAIGIMTLAVMTRASLGHTGHDLAASRITEVIYGLAIIAGVARIAASIGYTEVLLHVATFAWVGAFGGFVLAYGPLLVRQRRSDADRSSC